MQTKHHIERLLGSAGARPNKRLGQNFLIDLNLMRFLLDTAEIQPTDVVLEVGCGTGSLTEGLVERAGFVVSVEYDRLLAPIAARQVAAADNVRVIQGDILAGKHAILPQAVLLLQEQRSRLNGRLLLVANLPYHVAGTVMANLATGPLAADAMTVTVQKEVAERVVADPGSKRYGPLTIVLAATGDSRLIRTLPPGVFWPPPQIDSAIIRYDRRPDKVERIADMDLFLQLVHLFMSHRRKMLKACTKFAVDRCRADWPAVFAHCRIDPTHRPETLSADQYIRLANACAGADLSS